MFPCRFTCLSTDEMISVFPKCESKIFNKLQHETDVLHCAEGIKIYSIYTVLFSVSKIIKNTVKSITVQQKALTAEMNARNAGFGTLSLNERA